MKRNLPIVLSLLAFLLASYAAVNSRLAYSRTQASNGSLIPHAPDPKSAIDPSASQSSASNPAPTGEADSGLIALSATLGEIQGRLVRMESSLTLMQSGWDGLARRGLVPLSPEQQSELQRQVMDPAAALRDRLAAMQLLRRHGMLSDAALSAIAQLAQTSEDPNARRQIYGALDGMTNAVVLPALFAALSNETDARAREEAVDSLSSFSGDPKVQDWLRNAAANDPDPRVRREAQDALNDRFDDMPTDQLKMAAMDPNLSASEKLAALEQLRDNDAQTPEVISHMLDFYLSNQDPGTRAEILSQFDGVNDPILKIPLLDGLANDPNARVREEAADSLSGYLDDPKVVEWLQFAASNDPDSRVREEAADVLEDAGL